MSVALLGSGVSIGLGSAVLWILCFPLFGGLLLSAEALDKDNRLPIRNIYAGFRYKFRDLAVLSVCALLLLALFSLLWAIAIRAVAILLIAYFAPMHPLLGYAMLEGLSPWFAAVSVVFHLIPFAVIWFAPALVVLNDKTPLAAIRGSLRILRRNWLSLPLLWLTLGLPIIFLGWKWKQFARHMPDMMLTFLGCYIGLLPILCTLLVYVGHRHIVATREDEEEYD